MARRSVRRRRRRAPIWPWYAGLGLVIVLAAVFTGRLVAALTPSSDGPAVLAAASVPASVADNPLAALRPARAAAAVENPVEPDDFRPSLPGDATPTALALIPGTTAEPMATPIQAPRSSRYNSTALVPDQALSTLVANRIARLSGRVGVAIKDLDTGRGTLIDPDGEYQMASLFKLTVMYEVYKQRDLGALSFDETLVFTQRYVDYDLGTLDRPVGSTIQLGEALQRMIEISDNSSAVLLTDRVGSNNINQDLRALGLTHTRLFNDDLVTSPADMLSFMEMIARGEGLSPSTSAEMVRLLARQRVNDRIPRLLPDGITVAHKTGNLPGVVNDVGIVYEPGATYVVALLVDGTSDDGAATQAEAQVARDAYDYFQSLHNGAVTTFPTAAPTNTPRPVTPVPPTAIPLSPTQTPLPATEEPPTATLTATLALPTAVPGSPTTAPPTVVPTAVALSSPVPTATTAATPIAPVTSVPTALSNGTTAAVLAPARTPSAEPTTATIRQ